MADPEDATFRLRRSSDAYIHYLHAEIASASVGGTRGCAKASARRPSLFQLTVKPSCRELFSCNQGDDDALLPMKSSSGSVADAIAEAPDSLGMAANDFPGKENCSDNVANKSPTYAGELQLKGKPFAQKVEARCSQNHPPQVRRAGVGSRLQRATCSEHAGGQDNDAHTLQLAWARVNEEPADPPPSDSPTQRKSEPMAKLAYNISEPMPTLCFGDETTGGSAWGVATAKSAVQVLGRDLESTDMPLAQLSKKAQSTEFTLNRPAKTPSMVRLRRGSSYKFRAILDDHGNEPEEAPGPEDAVFQDEDAIYQDEDLCPNLARENPPSPNANGSVDVSPLLGAVQTPNMSPIKKTCTPSLGMAQWARGGSYIPAGLGHRRSNSNNSSCLGDASLPQDVGMQTPEMCAISPVNEHARPNINMFRQVSGREKRVILVRHAESTFNQTDSTSTSWEDPIIFDPPLTHKGVCQALALKEKLCGMKGLETALWVCSPLSRAIETMRYACPFNVEELVARNQLRVCAETTELLHTTGDIGLTASDLRRKFPDMAPAMADLPECWWYGTLECNNPWRRLCKQLEPKTSEEKRIRRFRKMLEERSERVVICFGHSLFWKHFIGGKDRTCLKNCEMHELTI